MKELLIINIVAIIASLISLLFGIFSHRVLFKEKLEKKDIAFILKLDVLMLLFVNVIGIIAFILSKSIEM